MYSQYSPELSSPTNIGIDTEPELEIGISHDQIEKTVDIFKVLLGMEYVLYVKLQNFHWNVTGMSFDGIHKLFEKQYETSAKFIDEIAEHIRVFGVASPGSMKEFV